MPAKRLARVGCKANATDNPPSPSPAISGLILTFRWSNIRSPPRAYMRAIHILCKSGTKRWSRLVLVLGAIVSSYHLNIFPAADPTATIPMNRLMRLVMAFTRFCWLELKSNGMVSDK